MSKYGEVRNDYADENGVIHIDAWKTADDNEEGTTIALVLNGSVYYKDYDATTDTLAQELIQEAVETSKQDSDLMVALKCALADLEGIMPEFEPSGDREHSAWKTIEQIKKLI
jgi:hypothetical protein